MNNNSNNQSSNKRTTIFDSIPANNTQTQNNNNNGNNINIKNNKFYEFSDFIEKELKLLYIGPLKLVLILPISLLLMCIFPFFGVPLLGAVLFILLFYGLCLITGTIIPIIFFLIGINYTKKYCKDNIKKELVISSIFSTLALISNFITFPILIELHNDDYLYGDKFGRWLSIFYFVLVILPNIIHVIFCFKNLMKKDDYN